MSRKYITLKLTPIQAHIVWNVVDGQADAGSCEGGNTAQEQRALDQVSTKLLAVRDQWIHVKLKEG